MYSRSQSLLTARHLAARVVLRPRQRQKNTLANLSKLPADLIGRIRQVLMPPTATATEAVCGAIFGVLSVIQALARQCGLVGPWGRREWLSSP